MAPTIFVVTFVSLSLLSFIQFIKFAQRVSGCDSLWDVHLVVRLPLLPLVYLVKTFALLYPLSLFMLLSWSDCYKVG